MSRCDLAIDGASVVTTLSDTIDGSHGVDRERDRPACSLEGSELQDDREAIEMSGPGEHEHGDRDCESIQSRTVRHAVDGHKPETDDCRGAPHVGSRAEDESSTKRLCSRDNLSRDTTRISSFERLDRQKGEQRRTNCNESEGP